MSTLSLVTVALVVLGVPAGLGTTMLCAHLRDAGNSTSSMVNTRATIPVARMGGSPLATDIIGGFGGCGVFAALVIIAVLNIVATAAIVSHQKRAAAPAAAPTTPQARSIGIRRGPPESEGASWNPIPLRP